MYVPFDDIQNDSVLGIPFNGTLLGTNILQLSNESIINSAMMFDRTLLQWIDMGDHKNRCLGNLNLCDEGFTLSVWVKITASHDQRCGIFENGGLIFATLYPNRF